ncbi:hypothetical protein KSP39_PZI011421 [Platanthera zijinensis]|uniref:Uncharacterized protein n=1 Tax=Platanthera zijinensis TaxID=2320716 RepID=A0AAP0BJX0_9ASPA
MYDSFVADFQIATFLVKKLHLNLTKLALLFLPLLLTVRLTLLLVGLCRWRRLLITAFSPTEGTLFPGRTDNAIKNICNSLTKRKQRGAGKIEHPAAPPSPPLLLPPPPPPETYGAMVWRELPSIQHMSSKRTTNNDTIISPSSPLMEDEDVQFWINYLMQDDPDGRFAFRGTSSTHVHEMITGEVVASPSTAVLSDQLFPYDDMDYELMQQNCMTDWPAGYDFDDGELQQNFFPLSPPSTVDVDLCVEMPCDSLWGGLDF